MKKSFGTRKLFVAALLCAGCFLAGCGESGVQEEESKSDVQTAVTPSAEAETVPETEEPFVTDSVPELDFDGATVNMAGQGIL